MPLSLIEAISHSSQLEDETRYLVKIISSQTWECVTYNSLTRTFQASDGNSYSWGDLLVYHLHMMQP
jgi:hypothetical protein